MSDLPIVALGDIVRVKGGKRLPKGSNLQTVPNDHPYIRVRDMGERYIPDTGLEYVPDVIFPKIQRYIVEENDVIISIVGTIGLVSVIDERFHLASQTENCAKLSGLDLIDALYVYYYLSSNIGQQSINEATVGAVQAKLPLYNIEKIPVIWPERKERELIVSNLGVLDNKIELNHQTNQTLEQIAQAIFKSWFVDFEPTRAKIAAKKRWQALHQSIESSSPTCYAEQLDSPNKNASSLDDTMTQVAMAAISGKTEEQLKELDDAQGSANVAGGRKPGATEAALQQLETTAALFPDALVESELGEIPEGWEYSEIGNEVTVVGGGTPSTKNADFWEGGNIHWTSPRDMSSLTDKILLDTNRKITEAGLGKISSGLLPINTVLMSSRAPVGYLAISKIPVAINQGYIAMKCESVLTPEYVVQWAESVMDDIKQRATGTTFAEISKKNFKIIPVVVPVDGVINEYTKIVSGLYTKITEGIRETKYLTESRNTLLPKLLSGEVSINNEIDVSEAVA